MRGSLNYRLLGAVLAGLLIASVGIHGWHRVQERRSARLWRTEAEAALRQEHWQEAARYLQHYLDSWPEDNDARAVYALTLEKAARTPAERVQAWQLLEQAVQHAPQRDDLRQEAVRLAVSLGYYAEAIRHLEILQPRLKEKTELEYLLGRCHEELGNYTQAAAAYEAVARQAPGVEVCLRWARLLYFRLERPAQALQVLDELVARQPQAIEARLARARFRREIGDLEQAWADLQAAQARQPEHREVLLLGAELAQARSDQAAARRFALQGRQRWPDEPYWYGVQAWAAERAGQEAEAVACLRQGLEKDPKNTDLLLRLAAVLSEVGDEAEAHAVLERARQAGAATAVLETLRARLLLRQGRWQAARTLLAAARPQLPTPSRWQALADLLRAQIFAHEGNPLLQLQASQQALVYDPTWPAARLSLASAWLEVGQAGPALEQLRELAALPAPPAALWPLLVQAQLRVELSRPLPARRWQAVQATLERAAQAGVPSRTLTRLRAEVLAAQGEWSQAEQLLATACQQTPQEATLWLARADLALRQRRWAQAQDWLRQAERQGADPPILQEGWVRYWLAQGDPRTACAALRQLAAQAEQLPADARPRLLRRLASALEQLHADADAALLWARLLQDCPEDQESRFHLLELALRQGQEQTARQLVEELRQREGDKGTWWRLGQALCLLARARQSRPAEQTPLLAEVRQLLQETARQQPGVPYLPLLLAVTEELASAREVAVRYYLEALAAGLWRADLVEHTVQLLLAGGQLESAEALLRQAAATGPVPRALARLGTEAALRRRENEQAAAWARLAVPENTRDYRDLLWLAQVHTQLGAASQATQILRRACDLAPRLPEPWLALLQHLVHQGDTSAAEQLLAEATKHLTGERRWRVRARGREILGQPAIAEKTYHQWLHAEPDNLMATQALAAFYLAQARPADAEPLLQQLAQLPPGSPPHLIAWARRQLALCLLSRAGADAVAQALALLEGNQRLLGPNREDDLIRARLLAAQPGQRAAAVQLLESWANQQPLPPDSQRLLARLYDETGRWLQARAAFLTLLARQEEPVETLVEYLHFLIRHREFSEAQVYLERLQRLAPQLPQTRQLADLLQQARALPPAGREEKN